MQVIGTYHIAIPSRERDGSSMLAVCVDGGHGDLAVYVGLVRLPDCDDPTYAEERQRAAQWVAANGRKQRYEEARSYFPSLSASEYRA